MPFPPENRRRRTDEEFVLFLQGIPTHCRWQELKDLVRQTALHIRQAVVYDDHHGFPTGLGQIIVKHEEAAWRTYQKLSTSGWDGQSLTVTLARTSSPTHPIAGPKTSPSCYIQSPPSRSVLNPATAVSMSPEYALPVIQSSQFNGAHNIRPVPVTLSPTYTEYMAPAMIMSPGMGMNMSMNIMHQPFLPPSSPSSATTTTTTTYIDPLSPHQPPRAPPTRPRKSLPVPHHHHPHHNHTPRIYPARRAIFIQNLPPSTSVTDLRSHLESAGPIEACEVFTDRATGLCKGFARVTFQTGEGAKRAVGMGNGSFFWGCRIRVRFDRYFGERGPGGDGEGREGGSVGTGAGTGDGTTNGIAKEETSETSKPAGGCHHQPLVVNGSVSGIGGGRKAEVD